MSPGPGRITDIIDVPLGTDRDDDTREAGGFFEKITEVREALRGVELRHGRARHRGPMNARLAARRSRVARWCCRRWCSAR
jgi:hypothetical protein